MAEEMSALRWQWQDAPFYREHPIFLNRGKLKNAMLKELYRTQE